MNNELINRELLLQAIQAIATKDKTLISMGAGVRDITTFYPYFADDKELFVKVRIDKDGSKWIKPFYYDGNCYRLGEPPTTKDPNYKKPLYHLPLLDNTVYIVEGEKCVHSLLDIGLTATTTGGATSIDKCDLTPLQGKRCIVWRDNDKSGKDWQANLSQALTALDIAYDVIDVDKVQLPAGEPMPAKGDCYDLVQAYFADGQDSSGIIEIIQALPLASIEPVIEPLQIDNPLQALEDKERRLIACIDELAEHNDIKLHLALSEVTREFKLSKDKVLSLVHEHKQGGLVAEIEPYHEPVTHDEIYTALYSLVHEHMAIDEPLKVAFVLWVIFTYLTDISDFAPIAWITAPERQCGKSTLLGLFERVVNKPMAFNNITQAVLYRVMEQFKPTLLIDEIDTSLKDKNELLGIVNAGYSRHASNVPRMNQDKGGIVEKFDVFGAKVFSGIGEMKGTFASRAIRFELRRKTNSDKVKRFNKRTLPHETTNEVQSKVKRWAGDNRQAVQAVQTPLLKINDRDFDNWEILLQIATVLGVYDKALQACLIICNRKDEPSLNEMLLSDIRDIFNVERMSSTDLLEKLNFDSEKCWQTLNNGSPLTSHQLAKKLKGFGIVSKNMRINSIQVKGFDKADFVKTWAQYLPPPPAEENPFLTPIIEFPQKRVAK
ncbi:DUF3631 domain-containing protein [Moraxella osloensis]|uniref:DUF3631 domain-containing protein n=1 Tax=Faucicola osloensis TaxID=34062 RepID=UPI00242A5388|nr:DUF3631 domain-containing protein [Moraxella osloensis]